MYTIIPRQYISASHHQWASHTLYCPGPPSMHYGRLPHPPTYPPTWRQPHGWPSQLVKVAWDTGRPWVHGGGEGGADEGTWLRTFGAQGGWGGRTGGCDEHTRVANMCEFLSTRSNKYGCSYSCKRPPSVKPGQYKSRSPKVLSTSSMTNSTMLVVLGVDL